MALLLLNAGSKSNEQRSCTGKNFSRQKFVPLVLDTFGCLNIEFDLCRYSVSLGCVPVFIDWFFRCVPAMSVEENMKKLFAGIKHPLNDEALLAKCTLIESVLSNVPLPPSALWLIFTVHRYNHCSEVRVQRETVL
jgi:hypothetical protein